MGTYEFSRSANLSDAYNSYSLLLAGSGWKLVGLSSSQSVPLDSNNFLLEANYSSGSINDIRKIWGYDGAWESYTPTEVSNSLTSLDPGRHIGFLMLSDLEINSQNINLSDLFRLLVRDVRQLVIDSRIFARYFTIYSCSIVRSKVVP